MELVPIIYKFLLVGGGLLVLVLISSYVASRMVKSDNNKLPSRQQSKVKFNERQIAYMSQKEQIYHNENSGNGEHRQSNTGAEVKEVKVVRRPKTERTAKSTRYSRERRTGENKPRFSIVNEPSSANEQSQYRSKSENEFKYYQQNYSNTG